MNNWPKYRSHKIVEAAKIVGTRQGPEGQRILLVDPFADGVVEDFEPSEPAMAERVSRGDYAIRYPDGFRSCSPAAAFEAGYRWHSNPEADDTASP